MDKQKYNATKMRKIVDTTLSNYANMIKRLERKKNISEFVLTYYSMFLIIMTLTGKYFPGLYDTTVSDYFNIILSVVVLIYSLIIKNANYSTRIDAIMDSLNKLKSIKRRIDDDNVEKCNEEYNDIVDKTERRDDVDFFITVKHLCKEFDINWLTKKHKIGKRKSEMERDDEYERQEQVVNDYLSEINVIAEQGKIAFEAVWNIILFVIPIVLFIICIMAKVCVNSPVNAM